MLNYYKPNHFCRAVQLIFSCDSKLSLNIKRVTIDLAGFQPFYNFLRTLSRHKQHKTATVITFAVINLAC